MTPYPTARIATLTQEGSDLFLMLQFKRDALRVIEIDSAGMQTEKVQISRAQLANIVKDGVEVLG